MKAVQLLIKKNCIIPRKVTKERRLVVVSFSLEQVVIAIVRLQ